MALEKRLADTDSIYCTKIVSSNQSSIFISNTSDPELNILFGADYKSDDKVRLCLDKRNLAFNSVAHFIDGRTWYRRKSGEEWSINYGWLHSHLQTLQDVFSNDKEVFIASLNKEESSAQRLYMKCITSLVRVDGEKNIALNDFLFSGDVIVLTKLDNGDVALDIKIPNNPIVDFDNRIVLSIDSNKTYQLIIYGAPGTGKSHTLKEMAKAFDDDHQERVTFYPTYTYQQFIGSYKPSVEADKDEKKNITYSFVPGPFLRLLIKAYNKKDENFLLIIEELNRANAAAIFGDAFQLLDRTNGESEYPINLSEDEKTYLKAMNNDNIASATKNYTQLSIPSNFYIWATMNSADQGVFPIDTAFKRRWDFKYLGIDTNEQEIENHFFPFQDAKYYWNTIRKTINEKLLAAKVNEDKLLGPFFIKLETVQDDSNTPFLEAFKSKVVMYLFEDAIRHNPAALFRGKDGLFSYSIICKQLEEGGLKAVFNFDIEPAADTKEPSDNVGQTNA